MGLLKGVAKYATKIVAGTVCFSSVSARLIPPLQSRI